MSTSEESRKHLDSEESFASRLAEFDATLASGQIDAIEAASGTEDLGELADRLEPAKECLLLLESIWPRGQAEVTQPPETIGRFRILSELGRGGFGVVYLARDDKLCRTVALKVQRPEAIVSPPLRSRFLHEAQAAGKLRHPNVATVYEVGQAGIRIWLATEYCDGGSLAAWLSAAHPVPSAKSVATFVCTLADALQYSHTQGVLHRDLKPSNVLLQRTSNLGSGDADDLSNYVPKLIDFGLAKSEEALQQETRTGALLGTPAYMAPEQANSQRDLIGPATDVYGLGVLLYELLTGQRAFRGESDLAVMRKVSEGDFVEPRVLQPELPRDMEAICLRALATRPADRYATPQELAADLRRFLNGRATVARPLLPMQRAMRWARRRPALAALSTVSLAATLVVVGLTTMYVRSLRVARSATEVARVEAEENAAQARQQELVANQLLYAARMSAAQQDLEQGNAADAADSLAPYQDGERLSFLRGFEWHYLSRRLSGDHRTLLGHRGEVYSVKFSPDDLSVVSGGQDGTIRVWDKITGKETARIEAHDSCVNCLSYSDDGSRLASGGCDGIVKIWNVASGKLERTLANVPARIECVVFTPGRTDQLAVGGHDPKLRIHDLESGAVLREFDTHLQSVKSAVWSTDGNRLLFAATSPDFPDAIYGWDVENDRLQDFPDLRAASSIAVSPLNDRAFVGLSDATIRVLGPGPQRTKALTGHHQSVESVAISNDGAWLASGSDDARILLWNAKRNVVFDILSAHRGRVQSLAFDREGHLLASASHDGKVKLWNRRDTCQQFFWMHHPCPDRSSASVALSPDLKYLVVNAGQAPTAVYDLSVFDIAKPAPQQSFDLGPLEGLSFIGADAWAATPAADPHRVHVWDARGNLLTTYAAAAKCLPACEGTVIVRGPDKISFVNNVGTTVEAPRPPSVEAHDFKPHIIFSPDRQTVGVSNEHAGAGSWLIDISGRKRQLKSVDRLRAVSNDGALIVAAHNTRAMRLIETATGKQWAVLPISALVVDFAFSPDSMSLATLDQEGNVDLWNVATGQRVARLPTGPGNGACVRFSSDSRALAAVTIEEPLPAGAGQEIPIRVTIWSGDRSSNAPTAEPMTKRKAAAIAADYLP